MKKNNILGNLHPISKLIFYFLFSLIVFLETNVFFNLLFSLISILLTAGIKFNKEILRFGGKALLRILLFILIMYSFISSIPSNKIYIKWIWGSYIGDLTIQVALAVSLRVISLLVISAVYFLSTPLDYLNAGLRQLKIPFPITFLIKITIVIFSNLKKDWDKLNEGYLSRGHNIDDYKFISKLKNIAIIIKSFIIVVFRKANIMALSAEIKGYNSRRPRSIYYDLPWNGNDYFVVFLGLFTFCITYIIVGYL